MPSPLAPTTTVSQLIATEVPKYATGAASEAVSLACSVHTPSQTSRTKTYAAPSEFWSSGSFEWNGAPTTALSPSIATDVPNSSLLAPSDARSFVVSVQMPVTGFLMKTYAEPAFAPPALSSNGAPTRIVLPLIATE